MYHSTILHCFKILFVIPYNNRLRLGGIGLEPESVLLLEVSSSIPSCVNLGGLVNVFKKTIGWESFPKKKKLGIRNQIHLTRLLLFPPYELLMRHF